MNSKALVSRVVVTSLLAVGVAGVTLFPQPRAAEAAVLQEAKGYAVDPVHSTIVFSAIYMGQSPFFGMFTQYSGSLSYDGSDPASLEVDVVAPMESIDTHNEQRDGHLKAPDWFKAAEYPTVRFVGSGASDNGDGTMTMQGELTLAGETKPIAVTLKQLASGQTPRGDRMGIGGTFTIKRSDFGVNTMMGDSGISDEITLHFGIQGVAK